MNQRQVERLLGRLEREADLRKQRTMFPNLQHVRAMFRQFNRLYFGGALKGWHVQYADRPGDRPPSEQIRLCFAGGTVVGHTEFTTNTLFLDFGLEGDQLAATLLHEMIHAGGARGHGKRFRAELARLAALGATLAAFELSYLDDLKNARRNAKRRLRSPRREVDPDTLEEAR